MVTRKDVKVLKDAMRKKIDDLERSIKGVQDCGVYAMSRLRELRAKYVSQKNDAARLAVEALMQGIDPEVFKPNERNV